VVEDEAGVKNVAVQTLKIAGYKVLEADCGDKAIDLSSDFNGDIDLLITDVVMPGMSGKQLADELLLHRPTMRVLFTSGYTENEITTDSILNDELQFLPKPYTPITLAHKAREVLDL